MIMANGHTIVPTIFPDKTSQVWQLPEEVFEFNTADIVWKFESEAELAHLIQANALLRERYAEVTLLIHYLPYARQDKHVSNMTTFALRPFAAFINSLDFCEVRCFDPHSHVASALIKNLVPVYPKASVYEAFEFCYADVVCYPDSGAFKKYSKVYSKFGPGDVVSANKVRNQITGAIEGISLVGNPEGQNVLIVDDICDGGATFIHLTRVLKDAGAKEVNLFVSHGIFSKGTRVLKDAGIKRIFTKEGEV